MYLHHTIRSRKIRRSSPPENSDFESSPPRSSPTKRKRKVKPLGDRLFNAAVQSGGDPIDDIVKPQDTDSCRIPLRFIAGDDCGSACSKRKARTLVDPRKAAPFRSATFSSRRIAPSTPPEAEHQPLSRWRADSLNSSSFNGCKPRKQKVELLTQSKSLPRPLDRRAPLSFIPLDQAEITFRHLKSNRSKTVLSCNLESAGLEEPDRSVKSEQLAFEIVKPLTPRPNNRKLEHLLSPASASSTVPAVSTPSSPICASYPQGKTTSDTSSNLHAPLDAISRQSSDSLEKKNLKPLASFFDGFLETARVVTENEAYGALTTPPLETASKLITDRQQLGPATLNSLQSFIRKSVKQQNLPQAPKCQTPFLTAKSFLPMPRKRSAYDASDVPHGTIHMPRHHGSLTPQPFQSGREAEDYDPSPDILAALQPQNYQVVLSSSPDFACSAPSLAETIASSPSSMAFIPDNLGLKGFCQFLREQ